MRFLPGDSLKIVTPANELDSKIYEVVTYCSDTDPLIEVTYASEDSKVDKKKLWINPNRIRQLKGRPFQADCASPWIPIKKFEAKLQTKVKTYLDALGHTYAPGNCPACAEWSPEKANHCIWRLISKARNKEITPSDPEWADRSNTCYVTFAKVSVSKDIELPQDQTNKDIGGSDQNNIAQIEVHREEPCELSGLLSSESRVLRSIPDIIEDVAKFWGGGKYRIFVISQDGKRVKTKSFEVSGPPKNYMTTLETVTSIENWLPNREVERDNRMQDFIKRIVPDGTISLRLYHSKSNVCLASYPVDRKISSIIEDAVEKHDDGLWEKGLYEIHAVDKTGTLYLEHFVVESFKNFAPPASPSDIANNDEPSDAEKLKFYEFHGAHLCDLENRNQELAEANDRLLAEIIKVRSDAEKDLKAEKEKQSVDLLKSNLIKSRCQMLEKQIKQLENELKGARCNQQLVQAPEGQKIWSKSTGLGPYTIIRAGITQELRLPDSQKPKQIEAYLCKSRAGANKVVPITDATMEPQAWGNLFYFLNLILYWVSFKKLR